jgi:antitoxin component YwqK of YwqJK toxin-antitoxin module
MMKLKALILLVGIFFIQQSFFGRNNSLKKETTFSQSMKRFEKSGVGLDHRYGQFDRTNDEIIINQFKTKYKAESNLGKNKQTYSARELKPKKPKVLVGKYKNDLKHGQWIIDDNGRITETNYELGIKNGLFCDVEANGDTLTIGNYLNGQRHGLWVVWKENELIDSGAYELGRKSGVWYTRYANFWVRASFTKGKIDSEREEVYHNGQQKYRMTYIDSTNLKIIETWFANGNLCSHEEYQHDREIGEWRYYHESGEIATKFTFTENKKITELWTVTGELIPEDSISYYYGNDFEQTKCLNSFVWRNGSSVYDDNDRLIYGTVHVGIVIDIDGTVRDLDIMKSTNAFLSEAIYEIFSDMPMCNPGKEFNHVFRFQTVLPVIFQ